MAKLNKLNKDLSGNLTLENQVLEDAKFVGEIEVKELILNILSSVGKYDVLKFRENLVPKDANAYYAETIETRVDPFDVRLSDYKVFRIKFYKIK